MRGLIQKALREVWLSTLLISAGLMAAMSLLTFVLPRVQQGINDVLARLPFVKALIAALLGIEVEGELTAQLMQSILWVHPVVLALIWAHEIMLCTRMPAGEIDRGTVDLLFGLPVTRMNVYLAETVVWLITGAVVLLAGFCGYLLTARSIPADARPTAQAVVYVLLNLYCLYIAVGGGALMVSTVEDRRGRAVGIIFSLVLFSFLLNFLAPLWEPANRVAFVSVMHYYQPAQIIKSTTLPLKNVVVLVVCGAATWSAGAWILQRRDICTV